MEPSRSTGNFKKRITVADANNIVGILDMSRINSKYEIFREDYVIDIQALLEDLKITVNLTGLSPASFPNTTLLMGDADQNAEIARVASESQKISLGLYTAEGNGPWEYESEILLMNSGGAEHHVPALVPFLSTNETFLVGENFKLGVRVEPKWNQPLKANDFLVIKGTYKQVVSFSSKKKDNNNEALVARVEALETLLSIFGAPTPTLPGTNGLVPKPPAGGENYLLKGDRTWQNPNGFIRASSEGIHGNVTIPNTPKAGWTGLYFEGPPNRNYLLQNPVTGEIGFYDAIAPKWNLRMAPGFTEIMNPLQINGSSTIKKILSLQTIISLPNIPVNGLHQVDISLTGAIIGGFVSISPIINSVVTGYWTFYCHAQILTPNVVSLFFKNDWIGAADLSDFWVRILYIEF